MRRRDFLKTSATAGLLASTFPSFGAVGSGKTYTTALIGCGWWGNNILGEAMASGMLFSALVIFSPHLVLT